MVNPKYSSIGLFTVTSIEIYNKLKIKDITFAEKIK